MLWMSFRNLHDPTLTGFSHTVEDFFGHAVSNTYDEEKRVEDCARRVGANLLSAKPQRNDFHTHCLETILVRLCFRTMLREMILNRRPSPSGPFWPSAFSLD
jgi:hypothetical protein